MPESSDTSYFDDQLISALDGSIANLRNDATTTLHSKDYRHELGMNADLINRLVREHDLSSEGDRPVFEVQEITREDGSKERWLLVSHRSVCDPAKILIWPTPSRPPNPGQVEKAINCLKVWRNNRWLQLERELMRRIERGTRPNSPTELRGWAEEFLQVIQDRMQAEGLSAIAVDGHIHTIARMAYEYALDMCPPEVSRQLQIPGPEFAVPCGEVIIRLRTLLNWCNKSDHLQISIGQIDSFAKRGDTTVVKQATVYSVLIASPSDVGPERAAIQETIHRWNTINSRKYGVVLEPVLWETHATPSMGDRPQAIINKQLVRDCDILVGVFWTRLGTPSGEAESGTVEEIDEFRKAGKPVMLYFSSVPVDPGSIDLKQYKRLQAFKEQCFTEGLVWSYKSISDLRDQLLPHLSRTVDGLQLQASTQMPPPEERHHERTAMEYKILRTLWTKTVNRFPKYEGAWTFRVNSEAPEFLEYRAASNRLMGEGLVSESDQGQLFLTRKGFEYCKKHHAQLPADEWWPEETINPELLKKALEAG